MRNRLKSIRSLKQVYTPGLIIHEPISNSLKYAFPDERESKIDVSLRKLENELELAVIDDGIGMPGACLQWPGGGRHLLPLPGIVENETSGSTNKKDRK